MTELDFDELDKAVNNLMADVGSEKRATTPEGGEDITLSIIPPVPVASSTQLLSITAEERSEQVAQQEPVQRVSEPVARPPLAVKRRGRFMDVVHPSSDMKTTGSSVPRREGVSIEPSGTAVVPEPTAAEQTNSDAENYDFAAAFDMESTKPAEQTTEQTAPEEAEVKNEWPDPIEFTQSHDSQSEPASAVADVPAEVISEIAEPSAEQPLSSPFLTDAKVEKRPLGGTIPVTDNPVESMNFASEPSAPIDDDTQMVAKPGSLPDELRTDVMALESSDTVTGSEITEPAPEPEVAVDSPEKVADEVVQPTQPSAGGAIAQQYAEQPSTSDQTSGSIYDTATYHQALEHPEKHKSGWTWIIWILLLLIAGAAAGAAYFYFTTQA